MWQKRQDSWQIVICASRTYREQVRFLAVAQNLLWLPLKAPGDGFLRHSCSPKLADLAKTGRQSLVKK